MFSLTVLSVPSLLVCGTDTPDPRAVSEAMSASAILRLGKVELDKREAMC